MRLRQLANEVDAIDATGKLDGDAMDVTHDSRECREGSVFVAIRGDRVDGHRFVSEAVAKGAIAAVSELALQDQSAPAWIRVADARAALAKGAAAVHGHPSQRLRLVGITGTNGKTTTAYLIDSIIRAVEGRSAMIGTVQYRIGDRVITGERTTPEASTVNRLLAEAARAGCRSAVMEVSSHSIELKRADALRFEAAVFTNLTPDHLDYHKTMENYFAAKARLFDGSLGAAPRHCVINADDEHGHRLAKMTRGQVLLYGMSERAQVTTRSFKLHTGGLHFLAETPAGKVEIHSGLVGRPHVYNILAAMGAGLSLGFSLGQIADGIAECESVQGRFERVYAEGAASSDFVVVVDYAHTEDALRNVLRTAREIVGAQGRVIAVFGCGGDRDRTKRAPMGQVAAELSDITIVTSDNPRSEDPITIISDVELGLSRTGRPYLKIPDRREAIFKAVADARSGDILVIAGKGHETYQIIGDRTIHFDDREVAREALKVRA